MRGAVVVDCGARNRGMRLPATVPRTARYPVLCRGVRCLECLQHACTLHVCRSHNHVTRAARARGYARGSTRCVRPAASSEAKRPEEGIGSCLRKRPEASCICCKSVVEREMDEGVLTPRMTSKCGGTAGCVLQDKVLRVALLELPRGAEVSRWQQRNPAFALQLSQRLLVAGSTIQTAQCLPPLV